MLRFKQFVSEVDSIAADYKQKKDTDDEVKDIKPRSKGEEDFKKTHTDKKKVQDHPVASKDQFKDDDGKHDRIQPNNGERTAPEQGTSKLKTVSGFGKSSARKADRSDNGEKAMPKLKEDNVIEFLEMGTGTVELQSGAFIALESDVSQSLLHMYKGLNEANQTLFRQTVVNDLTSFDRLVALSTEVD